MFCGPGCTCVGCNNKQARDQPPASSSEDSDLDNELLETEVITDDFIHNVDIV